MAIPHPAPRARNAAALLALAGTISFFTSPSRAQDEPPEPAPKAAPDNPDALPSEESLARFQQVLQRRPFHGPAFTGLVEDYIKRGKLNDLIDEYKAKSASLPDNVALKIILARLNLRAKDAPAAAAALDKVDRLPPELAKQTSELLVLKSEIYQMTGDNSAAERMLKEAQKLATTTSESLRLGEAMADLDLRQGKKEAAAATLEELAARFPDNYLHQQHVVAAMVQRGLHDAALKRYAAILKLVESEVDRKCEVLRGMGLAQEKLGQRDQALASYTQAIGLLSSTHWMQKELHERVVTLYRATNRLSDLVDYCNAQIKRAPEQTSMRVLLADVQAALGKPDDGKKTLADAVALFPKDLPLSLKRIEFLERAGDAPAIADEYQRIIGHHPADAELYISYGQFLAGNHQVEGARGQWRHVLDTKVEDATLAQRLGALFEAYELSEDAAAAYERAIAVSPRQPEGYLALSRMWTLRAEPEKAAAALDRLGTANPNDAAVQAALAQALRNLGKPDAALAAIDRACEIAPTQVKYPQMKADLLVQAGQLEQALAVRRDLVDKLTSPVQQVEAIATLVSMHASAGTLPKLIDQEKQRLTTKPNDVNSLLILARAADAQRDFAAMRGSIDQLLKVDPANETGLKQLAKLQDATGDIDAAVATYTKLIQLHPNRARPFYEAMVDVKLRYSDRAGAVATLENLAKSDPASVATQSAVAEQLVRMQESDRALPYFDKALSSQPDRHESRLEYGKALLASGRLEDAAAAFKAVALQRTDTDRAAEALGRLHDVVLQLGTLEDLIDDLHKQVELDPRNTLVARVLAELLVQELEYERAMELLDLMQKHNPTDVDLAFARGELLRKLGKFDESIEDYQRVLRFPQIDRDYALGELGKAHFEAGHVDQARRLWRQIQNKTYAGSLLKNNGLLDDAIASLEEGIRIKPDDFALHRALVAALEGAGKTAESLAAARRLLDLEPGNVWNIEKLASAYLRNNDRAGAADVASRLFSAGVAEDKTQQNAAQYGNYASAMYQASYASYARMYGGYGNAGRTNLERGVAFFMTNGLIAELEAVLNKQLEDQPDNAVLRKTAADLFGADLNKPDQALELLRSLETASFPVEHRSWLGKSSQRDHLRVEQYNFIASKPAMRDSELAKLEGKKSEDLSREETIELAIIRKAQGNTDDAVALLTRAAATDPKDTLVLGVLTDMLVSAEKFKEAEPRARKLVELLGAMREQMQAGIIERVRREFVRTLPLELQLRVNENVLADIADKWTMGGGWSWDGGGTEAPGYLKAKLTLATICAETQRMEEARTLWHELAPKRGPDVDRWTMLGDTAQLHKQEDLAFEFYSQALEASKKIAGDPLYQQVYTTNNNSWYDEGGGVDHAFSSIVEAFSKRDKLVELYDYLRDTNQLGRAKRLAEQYKLSDKLKAIYVKRVEQARADYQASPDSRFKASVPYFAQACKLAELYDREGKWDEAQKVYAQYCDDFPDELVLMQVLGEVAQARQKLDEAIAWEKKVLDGKARLATKAREWSQRELAITPAQPQPLVAGGSDSWEWNSRWGGRNASWYGYNNQQNQLERWPSWMRLAQLHLAMGNHIAAGDAMQRGVGEASTQRESIVREASGLIQQRQLTAKMLPVLRTLAVYAPNDERLQLSFAESLEAAGRKELAAYVCNRLLRRGVADLGVLAEIKRRLASLNPEQASAETTLESLKADADANPTNLKNRLRLAKAYYFSLDVDKAAEVLTGIVKEAPHLEGIHELLVEVHTLRGDGDQLVQALKDQIERTSDEQERRQLRWRLVNELLTSGKTDEALNTVKDLGDPRDPQSYTRIGVLLQYFGKHDEALACFEKTKSNVRQQRYGQNQADFGLARAMIVKGDVSGAAAKIMEAVDEQSKAAQSQGGGIYAMYEGTSNPFQPLEQVFVLYPSVAKDVSTLVEARRAAAPADPQVIKLSMSLYKSLGRPDQALELLNKMAEGGGSDQKLVAQQIDAALKRKEFEKAIAMAEKFIAQQPKPKPAPGMPAQYAAYAALQSPRTFMLCKLGDIHWDMGEKDKAFDAYKQIVDEKMEPTKLAYASICTMRGRAKEASEIVEAALSAQQVKTPALLVARAELAALEGKSEAAFDAIAEAAKLDTGEGDPYGRGGGTSVRSLSALAMLCGQFDKFVEVARDKIRTNPLDWESYHTLASAYHEAGRFQEALAVLDEAGQEPALEAQVLSQRMEWLRNTASVDELIAMTKKSIELAEKNVDTNSRTSYRGYGRGEQDPSSSEREALGNLLWEKGDRAAAVIMWNERADAQRAETYARLARLYAKQEAFTDAKNAYERAVQLDTKNMSYRLALAEQLFAEKDYKGMLPHMLEVFHRTNGNVSAASARYRSYDDESMPASASQLGTWATAMAHDDAVKGVVEGEGVRAEDCRVMLASLTGDWESLERTLHARIEKGSYDPLDWSLWAKVQQRKGDWKEAARALSFLDRAKLTTIAQRREKLELVLAGKQFKEAAAGQRQAQPNAGMQAQGNPNSYGGYSRSSYYDYDDSPEGGDALASIYLKLGDAAKAERLYLISGGGDGIRGRLPQLARLMWEKQAKERALELMRLSLMSSGDRYGSSRSSVGQYAAMLAETGKTKEAIELLVRAYRWDSSGDREDAYSALYGRGNRDESMERGQSDSLASSLYEMLNRNNLFDATLKYLREESERSPQDSRLAQLVLSMQKRAGRWTEVRESLARWRGVRPDDLAMKLEDFHAACQVAAWDDALKVLGEIRKDAPDQPERWAIHEAFVHAMRDDAAKASALLEPLVKSVHAMSEREPERATTAMLCLNRLDSVLAKLETELAQGELSENDKQLLFRLYAATGKRDQAAKLALDELWKQATALTPGDAWLELLTSVVSDGGAAIVPSGDRAADVALLTLITQGPAKGETAFSALAKEASPTLEALRGHVLAAQMAGDDRAALAANTRLLEWLAPRRYEFWRAEPHASMQRLALQAVDQLGRGGTTQIAMDSSGGQILRSIMGDHERTLIQTYDALFNAQQEAQRALVARVESCDATLELMRRQERLLSGDRDSGSEDRYSAYSYSASASALQQRWSSGYTRSYAGNSDAFGNSTDRRTLVRRLLWNAGRIDLLDAEYAALGARVREQEWNLAGAAAAAMGRLDEAVGWRARKMEAAMAALLAADVPTLGSSDSDRWSWYYRFRNSSQESAKIRAALQVTITDAYWGPDGKSVIQGEANEAWELAIIDPSAETQLLACESRLGTGWGSTGTFRQVMYYYKAREDAKKVLALIEKAFTPDQLVSCPHASLYVWACFKEKAWGKLSAFLDAAEKYDSTLKNEVDIARLVALRAAGEDQQAEALESRLLAACVREPANKSRVSERLAGGGAVWGSPNWGGRSWGSYASYAMPYRSYRSSNSYSYRSSGESIVPASELATVPEFAEQLGVRFDRKVRVEDVQIASIRAAYQRHGMHERAAQLIDLELAQAESSAARRSVISMKARELYLAKKASEAERVVGELETMLKQAAADQPGRAQPWAELAELYLSEEGGLKYAMAEEAIAKARRLDSSDHSFVALNVRCLYKQGKAREALAAWQAARRGTDDGGYSPVNDPPTIFYAALSASAAGEKELGAQLARQAVYMYPTHVLASQVQELLK